MINLPSVKETRSICLSCHHHSRDTEEKTWFLFFHSTDNRNDQIANFLTTREHGNDPVIVQPFSGSQSHTHHHLQQVVREHYILPIKTLDGLVIRTTVETHVRWWLVPSVVAFSVNKQQVKLLFCNPVINLWFVFVILRMEIQKSRALDRLHLKWISRGIVIISAFPRIEL